MDSISVGNGCFPLDSCGGDSDRGAIAGNHCRHHSRHQGCTMYIAVPAYFCVYIERRPLELKYCFFYNQGGRRNTSWLEKPCFRELCIAYGRSIYLLKIEKDAL